LACAQGFKKWVGRKNSIVVENYEKGKKKYWYDLLLNYGCKKHKI
jgi:hypothetical protein